MDTKTLMLDITRLTALHALELRCAVGAADTTNLVATSSKPIMLAALRAAELALLATCARIPVSESNTRPVCGVWTLRDLVGHLADWDRYFCNWLAVMRGQPAAHLPWNDDGDAFNQYLYEQRRNQSFTHVWHDFRTQRQLLVTNLAAVPDAEMLHHYAPADNMPFPSIYHCAWSALEHYLDHASGLRRSLGLALPPETLTFRGPYTE